MGSLAPLLIALLSHGPELFQGAEEVFNSIAHGPGGATKIAGALGALNHLTGAVANAAQVVQSAGADVQTGAVAATAAAEQQTEATGASPVYDGAGQLVGYKNADGSFRGI